MPTRGGRWGSPASVAVGIFVMFIMAISPLIFGSNNAATQMVETFLIVGVCLCYFGWSRELPVEPGPVTVLVGIAILFSFLQLLPLGGGFRIGSLSTGMTASVAPGDTWIAAINLCGFAAFAVLVHSAARHDERRRVMLVAAITLVSGYAILGLVLLRSGDTLLFVEKTAYQGMATATFVNRNSFATFLSMGIAAGVAWMAERLAVAPKQWQPGRNLSLMLATIGIIAMAAALVATNSRMGLFAGACGASSVVVIALFSSRRRRLSLALFAVGALVVGSILFVLLGTELVQRAITAGDEFGERAELYRQVAGMIAERPFIGFGLKSFEVAFPLFHQLPLSVDATIRNAHSTYLALWVELGVIVGTLPMIAIAILFRRAVSKALKKDEDWSVAAAAAGAIVVCAVHSTVDFSLEIQANSYLFIYLLMLLPIEPHRGTSKQRTHASR